MRFLLTTQPGTGHLQPMLPLARSLEQAGHTVAFACGQTFVGRVEAAGFLAFAAGLDWLESEPEVAFPEMASMTAAERDEALTDIFVDISANHMTYDLLELCREWQPDVLVRDYSEYGACIAGEVLGIPHAVIGLGLYIPDYITRLVMEKPLAYLRSAYGLPPHPAMEMLTKYLYLSLLPPSYQLPEYPLPAVTHTLRPAGLEKTGAETLPDWVYQLQDQPTIYASMGTVFNRMPEIFRIILEGLRDEPVNLIMTVGRNQDPAQFGATPENVFIEQFIPQAALMPHCDAVITHGGINTILTGLSHGLPLVVIPLVGHQLQNVTRCEALGVGIPLRPCLDEISFESADALPPDAPQSAAMALFGTEAAVLSPASVRASVQRLLAVPSYRQAAQGLQAEMAALPAPEHGVRLLEQLATERRPLGAQ